MTLSLFGDAFQEGIDEYNKGNKKKAVKLYKKACDDGDAGGCNNLGILYYKGESVRQEKKS